MNVSASIGILAGGKEIGDHLRRPHRLIITMLLLGVLLLPVNRAAAQQDGVLVISSPDTASFPEVRFTMDAYNEKGSFISTIKTGDIKIIEDGKSLKPTQVERINNGLQVIVAMNLASSLDKKTEGVSDYERIQQALAAWANTQAGQQLDDFSLSTPTGLFLIRSSNSQDLAKAVLDYQPELARAQSSLNSLAEALDLATDPPGRPLLKRSILYITPPLPADQENTLKDLANRALQIGVRVNVWMIGAAAQTGMPNALEQFATTTGGKFSSVPSGSPLPNPETLFQDYRFTYEIRYTSAAQKSGDHALSIIVENAVFSLASNESSFPLTINPPNPIFLSPPDSVQRTWTTGSPTPVLSPEIVTLQILIEFTDQIQRDVKATRLYVNGVMVDENSSAPFDRFDWNISSIESSGRQLLRVEAFDVLGLSGTSIDVPVEIIVDQPATTSVIQGFSGRGLLALSAVAVSGIVLVLVLFLTGTATPERWKRRQAEKQLMKDPVTQPVTVRKETKKPKKGKGNNGKLAGANGASAPRSSAVWPVQALSRQLASPTAPARLVALDENEQPMTGGSIPLSRQEITFGSDPRRASHVLESPTVDGLHARLTTNAEGQMMLADQGSVAGTWVNYVPVGKDGVVLVHGDLIHIGRITYRFERTDATANAPVEVKVTSLEV